MKVILRTSVKGLGEAGAVVEAAPGFARNFLLPRGLAVEASKAALHDVEAVRLREAARSARTLDAARDAAAKLDGASVRVSARAGSGGRLFGSITSQDLATSIAQQLGVKVDRRRLELGDPIKAVGTYAVAVRLHPEVQAHLTVEVDAT